MLLAWFRQSFIGRRLQAFEPLLAWAAHVWRKALTRPTFIAITGSLGKTTAKACLVAILRSRGRRRVFASLRGQNAGALISLNVFRTRPWHSLAVFEMAAHGRNTLARTSRVVRPHIGVILRVARTHTIEYDSIEAIADEKWSMAAAVQPGGTLLLNGDDPRLVCRQVPETIRRLTFGLSEGCDFRGSEVAARWPERLSFTIHHRGESARVKTQLVGEHWLHSVLAAVATATLVGLTLKEAADGASSARPYPARMQPVELSSGAILIRDEYNGSVDSYGAALRFLAEARAQRKIVIFGDVTDTDERVQKRLRDLGEQAARLADVAVFFGNGSKHAVKGALRGGMPPSAAHGFYSLREVAEFVRTELKAGDLALLKGTTTGHLSRIALAQFGQIKCWQSDCKRRCTCDFCWKLGLPEKVVRNLPSPPAGEPA